MFKQYDVVVTTRVLTSDWGALEIGSEGTIVEVYREDQVTRYEVEFVMPSGITKALITLRESDMKLLNSLP